MTDEQRKEWIQKHMPREKPQTFHLTNIDGDGSLWIGESKQLDQLEPLEEWEVKARTGEVMSLRDSNDPSKILMSWTIVKEQRQVVVTKSDYMT
jgi:cellobiose phosphorylase